MIDPLSPISAAARFAPADPDMPDCFVAAALEEFILIDADDDMALEQMLRAAH